MDLGDSPDILGDASDLHSPDLRHGRRPAGGVRRPGIEVVVPNLTTFDIPPLEFYEQFGGHTLRRHVGTTGEQDIQRMQREPDIGAAGSFLTVDVAERAMKDTVRDHADAVEKWLRRGAPGVFVAESYFDQAVGQVLTRVAMNNGVRQPAPATGARIVLRRADHLPGGFLVRTCYPVIAPTRNVRLRTLVPEPAARERLLAPYLVSTPGDGRQPQIDRSMPRMASFLDADVAESAIDAALETWGQDIKRWVVFGGGEEYRAVHRCHTDIGHAPPPQTEAPARPTQKLRFVLRRDDSATGFSVAVAEPVVTASGDPEE